MDLKTHYLGLELKHPIVASASPISQQFDGIRRLEDSGAAAIVMFSLFEEQIRFEAESHDFFDHTSSNSFAESLSFFPNMDDFEAGPDEYLDLIRRAKRSVEIPIIASLNACTPDGWSEYALKLQQAGADAIELNPYFIPSYTQSSMDVEKQYEDMVAAVRRAVVIPISVKLPPYFSSMGYTAKRLVDAGANGLVLFNRLYQPDFDMERQDVRPSLELSHSGEIRLPLLWIANLYGNINGSLAGTTGVHRGHDVAKYILAGADVAMTTSSLLKNGTGHLAVLMAEFVEWANRHGYRSVEQMKGSMSKKRVLNPAAFDRANYVKVLQSYLPKHLVG